MAVIRQSDFTPAQRAHARRVVWLMIAYAVILPLFIWVLSTRHVAQPLMLGMAMIASLPLLGIFASWGRYLSEERDEYQQSVMLRQTAVATNVTMGVAVVWGFLQAFGVMPLIETYWIAVIWAFMQGAIGLIAAFSRGRCGA